MRRSAPTAIALGALVFLTALFAGGFVPAASAVTPDSSDVVLVFDFSGSVTNSKTTRDQLADALDDVADRVTTTTNDLITGDTTVSLVQFADTAANVPGCSNLLLKGSPSTVELFALCLHKIADQYRKGVPADVQAQIGTGTDYSNALKLANEHLPASATRPAIIFFTNVAHDGGKPARDATPTRDQLFKDRSAFALLPVGLALDPKEITANEEQLHNFSLIQGMPSCTSGDQLVWPTNAFGTPGAAGEAVGQALADATCTFTVAPSPGSSSAPPVSNILLTPKDGEIDLTWTGSSDKSITGYVAQCRDNSGGDWIGPSGSPSTDTSASITGLKNGTLYACQVAPVKGSTTGNFVAASSLVTPAGAPVAPGKPTITAANGEIDIAVPAPSDADNVAGYTFECSSDGGTNWTASADSTSGDPSGVVPGVDNGSDYVCRAYALNASGEKSAASPVSDSARPCANPFQCTPVLLPIAGGVGALLLLALILAFIYAFRGRQSGHVVAVVDVVHTANIGHGSNLGIAFVQSPETKRVTGIVSERGKNADVQIKRLRGDRFEVRDKTGTKIVNNGDAVVVADSVGARHSLELRAFSTNAASRVTTRR